MAQRVSSINAISAICEKTGADIRDVSRAVGADARIGPHFLQASLGFGGSCFRKDLLNLIYISESLNLPEVASYWCSVLELNEYQQTRFARRIVSKFNNTLQDKRIAIFGFAFKANTHDTRDSQTIPLCNALLDEKACIAIYDPKVRATQIVSDLLVVNSVETVQKQVVVCSSAEEAVTNAYAIVICTEWPEFKTLDYKHLLSLMNRPSVIFDGRVLLNHNYLQQLGFEVESIGVDTSVNVQNFVSH
ncbi:unnamed protein product [Echinostoma caproni]|uniref:UDP-glucose 6-dehydrogenase n=1 Tax=Echinostoma caproni TaxID=27848 RepID=A0A3P8I5L6_9TREM|nr:unnamed protein product [Echinostoma caproni]